MFVMFVIILFICFVCNGRNNDSSLRHPHRLEGAHPSRSSTKLPNWPKVKLPKQLVRIHMCSGQGQVAELFLHVGHGAVAAAAAAAAASAATNILVVVIG